MAALEISPDPVVLGRYELHSIIATGGMASIHLGRLRGASGFLRTVAIKRLHPHYARDPAFVSMFMNEAQLVARIRHPNVVPIVDVVAEQEELFLVMEYVHGDSLARLVHDDVTGSSMQVPPPIAAAIFADVLHGLHASHEAKTAEGEPLSIVHRDVTPHNVLVGIDGSARITDFGIAKATQRNHSTGSGLLKGKLCYIAPEQLHGREVGRGTDVYGAAVSLWEALTGRTLFSAENEARVLERILTGAARPPSEWASDIPPLLDDIVMRGLEMSPRRRFPTAREMAMALEKCVVFPSASEIGSWVQARAERAIAQRVALIESLERMPLIPEVAALSPAASTGAATVSEVLPKAQRRHGALIAVGAVAAVGAVLTGAWLAHLRMPTASVVNAPPAQASTAPEPKLPPAPIAVISGSAPVPEPPPVTEAPKRPSTKKNTVKVTSRAPEPQTAEDPCKPPYTRDETGRKIYKRECL